MNKIYIITGANGFLGNNIIRKLEQEKNSEIRAFVLKGESIKSLENLKCKIYIFHNKKLRLLWKKEIWGSNFVINR